MSDCQLYRIATMDADWRGLLSPQGHVTHRVGLFKGPRLQCRVHYAMFCNHGSPESLLRGPKPDRCIPARGMAE